MAFLAGSTGQNITEARGLASIEDSVDASIQRLEDYIEKRGGRLITATRSNTDNTRISKSDINRYKRENLKNCGLSGPHSKIERKRKEG